MGRSTLETDDYGDPFEIALILKLLGFFSGPVTSLRDSFGPKLFPPTKIVKSLPPKLAFSCSPATFAASG